MKWILVLLSLLLFIAISFTQYTRIEILGTEMDSFREEVYLLESNVTSLQDKILKLEGQELSIDEIWDEFNFPISLMDMRMFIGMFLDAINDGNLNFNR